MGISIANDHQDFLSSRYNNTDYTSSFIIGPQNNIVSHTQMPLEEHIKICSAVLGKYKVIEMDPF